MIANASSADLQRKIRQVRQDLDSHSEEMVRRARAQLDWRNFVAKHPLVAMGAAAAAGYLLAPRRLRCQCVDEKVIKETVERALARARPGAPATTSKAPGLVAGLASMVLAVVVREGLSLASQLVRDIFDSQAGGAERTRLFNQSGATASRGSSATTNGEHP